MPYAILVDDAEPGDVREALTRSGAPFTGLTNIEAFVVATETDPAPALGAGVRTFRTKRDHVQVAIGIDALLEAGKTVAAEQQPNGLLVDEEGRPSPTPRPHPRLVPGGGIAWDDEVLPTQTGRLTAINLSLGTWPWVRFTEDDIVNRATRKASDSVPVVMAAGNYARRPPHRGETVSAWAEPDWVISVGATDSPDGGRVDDDSSRGVPDDESTWPTVVAYGQSSLSSAPEWSGTSFAAPRVAALCAQAAAFMLNVVHVLRPASGIPLVAIGIVDRGFAEPLSPRTLQLPSLPCAGVDASAVGTAADILSGAGRRLELPSLAAVTRSLVVGSAQPLPGEEPFKAGAGFVSGDALRSRLESLTGLDLAELVSTGPELPPDAAEQLAALRPADRTLLGPAMELWLASARQWIVHRETGRRIDLTWARETPAADALPGS